jgi:hypothetical protein
MKTITENLLTNWNFMRWLRLGLAIFIGMQAIELHDPLAGMIAAFFLFQVITNTGCCGSAGCVVPSTKQPEPHTDSVDYEEIKSPKE